MTQVRSVQPVEGSYYTEIIEVSVPTRFYWGADGFDGIEFGPFEADLQSWEEEMIDRCLEAIRRRK